LKFANLVDIPTNTNTSTNTSYSSWSEFLPPGRDNQIFYLKMLHQWIQQTIDPTGYYSNKNLYSKVWVEPGNLSSAEEWRLYMAASSAEASGELRAMGYDVRHKRIKRINTNIPAKSTMQLVFLISRHDNRND
jgi:hypothetical protein